MLLKIIKSVGMLIIIIFEHTELYSLSILGTKLLLIITIMSTYTCRFSLVDIIRKLFHGS